MLEKGVEWCTNLRKTSPYLTCLQLLRRGNPRVLAARRKTALHTSDAGAKKRDRHFVSLQEQVGCTLIIVSNLMSEVKQEKMDRRNVQLPDATRLLASHKDISQQRRESLRLALNKVYRVICAALHNEKLTSNEFLFGEDLTKRADEALKAKRLANKLTGSNVANGNSRGRGYQNRTYLQYQNKRSGFPQYQNQWQYAYQNRYNGGKRNSNRQTGASAPNTRNSHLTGTPAPHY